MMLMTIVQSHRLHQRVQTEPRQHADGHPAMQGMRMAVFDPHGNNVQSDLDEESRQHQSPNPQSPVRSMAGMFTVLMIQLRQQVEKSQAQQISPGESIKQLDV